MHDTKSHWSPMGQRPLLCTAPTEAEYIAELTARIAELEKDRALFGKELACAGMSLISYEESDGTGRGHSDGFDIARLLGYEDDLVVEDVMDWLRKYLNAAINQTAQSEVPNGKR